MPARIMLRVCIKIVKDAVSFYNSYGEYPLIVGVDEKSRNVIGYSCDFDVEDLNKKIHGVTDISIECIYRIVVFMNPDGHTVSLGLYLFVPRRSASVLPVQFKKNAPPSSSHRQAVQGRTVHPRSETPPVRHLRHFISNFCIPIENDASNHH